MRTLVTCTINVTKEELVAAGKYDEVKKVWRKDLMSYYRLPDTIQLGEDPQLFHIDRDPGEDGRTRVWYEEVVKGMREQGCRPATIWELLDYGAKHPETQLEFPIVALGTVTNWFCNAEAPVLGSETAEDKTKKRTLGIAAFGQGLGGFHPSCRFLMFRDE